MNFMSFLRRKHIVCISACSRRLAFSSPVFRGRTRTLLNISRVSRPPVSRRKRTRENRSFKLLMMGVPVSTHRD